MYIVKNAWKNIIRAPMRNLLMIVIVVVVSASSCIALSIMNAADESKNAGLDNINITASIEVDRQALMEKAQDEGNDRKEVVKGAQGLSLEEMETYAKSEYVKEFYYTASASLNAESIEAVSSSSSGEEQGFHQMGRGGMQGMGNQGDFSITGYSSTSAMSDFNNGIAEVSEGTIFDFDSEELTCIINSELAAYNEISVGDTITFTNPSDETQTYDIKVVGIYEKSASDNSSASMFSSAMDSANQIYMSYNALHALVEASNENASESTDETTGMTTSTVLRSQTRGTYVLGTKEAYENFKKDVEAMGLDDGYTVSSQDVNAYESSLEPLENLSKFAGYFLIVVLVVGGAMLVVFNMFHIRERKYEVGVLCAIGMKKGKVAIQFILELLLVSMIGIVIGTGIGAVSSVPVANSLLESSSSSETSSPFGEGGPGTGKGGMQPGQGNAVDNRGGDKVQGSMQYLDEINAAVDLQVLAMVAGLGLVLTIISSLSATTFIMRYEPLKILSERS